MDAIPALRAAFNPAFLQGALPGTNNGPAAALALRPVAPADVGQVGRGGAVAPAGEAASGSSFEGVLSRFVGDVNGKMQEAGEAVHGLLSGDQIPLHRVMIAAEEASLSFQLMVEVRNKLLDAYQELMRMQV